LIIPPFLKGDKGGFVLLFTKSPPTPPLGYVIIANIAINCPPPAEVSRSDGGGKKIISMQVYVIIAI
jgi:hypothetical protein